MSRWLLQFCLPYLLFGTCFALSDEEDAAADLLLLRVAAPGESQGAAGGAMDGGSSPAGAASGGLQGGGGSSGGVGLASIPSGGGHPGQASDLSAPHPFQGQGITEGQSLGFWKATTFGQSDDEYLDSNTAAGIGNSNNRLVVGVISVNPEALKQFGLRNGDVLSFSLPNGERVFGYIGDTTKEGLRNHRFDLYTPDGTTFAFDGAIGEVRLEARGGGWGGRELDRLGMQNLQAVIAANRVPQLRASPETHASASLERALIASAATFHKNGHRGKCAEGVANQLQADGYNVGWLRGHAHEWDEKLRSSADWRQIAVSGPDDPSIPDGAVLVYDRDAVPGTEGGSRWGHVERKFTDNGRAIYISDYVKGTPGGSVPENFIGAWVLNL